MNVNGESWVVSRSREGVYKRLGEGNGHDPGCILFRQYSSFHKQRLTDRVPLPIHDSAVPSFLFRLPDTYAQRFW
jgi:hypothetical protein